MTGRPRPPLRVALLTREYPPEVYGGAGVHVEYLARELAELVDLTVHCQGADRPAAVAHRPWDRAGATPTPRCRRSPPTCRWPPRSADADLVHSHTWYANLAGHLAALLYGIPHVVTVHSLEPLRPWKAEQLGGGYALSSWCERDGRRGGRGGDRGVRRDAGRRAVDLPGGAPGPGAGDPQRHRHRAVRPRPRHRRAEQYGIDPARPNVVFVGRITRQKGVPVLLRAAAQLDPAAQLVLCAGQAGHARAGTPR